MRNRIFENMVFEANDPALDMAEVLDRIFSNPKQVLGDTNIFLFEVFWNGWRLGRGREDENKLMLNFWQWAKMKHQMPQLTPKASLGWADLYFDLAKYHAGEYTAQFEPREVHEDAIQRMKEDWRLFIKSQLRYEPKRKKSAFRSIDDPWEDPTQKKRPQTKKKCSMPVPKKQVDSNGSPSRTPKRSRRLCRQK